MLLRDAEAMLREQGRFDEGKPATPAKPRRGLFRRIRPATASRPVEAAAKAAKPARPTSARPGWLRLPRAPTRSDFVIACLGTTLGLICALFPWYIFFNQEQFGVRAMKFSGQSGPVSGPIALGDQPQRIGAPMSVENIPTLQLDLFATGTVKTDGDDDGQTASLAEDQPFPFEDPEYRLVHVANGRAMIEDDAGLFVVQRGSRLPDNSRVAAIEQRDGKWVLVTSADRVIGLSQ